MKQQLANEATDHLRSVAACALLKSNPEDTLTMASRISDSTRRDDLLVRVLGQWAREDPAAAQVWIAQAKLSPDVAGRLAISGK